MEHRAWRLVAEPPPRDLNRQILERPRCGVLLPGRPARPPELLLACTTGALFAAPRACDGSSHTLSLLLYFVAA